MEKKELCQVLCSFKNNEDGEKTELLVLFEAWRVVPLRS